jgi:CRP/FNR family transcriptional regulator, cyclic AMP receptor protein
MTPDSTPSPATLPALGFLAGIPEEHRSFMACYGRYLRPQNGDVLIAEGQSQESFYVLLEGKAHVVTGAASGQPNLLASLNPGASIGEINLFDPAVASASVICRSSCLMWSLSREELDSFLAADAVIGMSFLRALLGQMSKRIRIMIEKVSTTEKKSAIHDFWGSSQR